MPKKEKKPKKSVKLHTLYEIKGSTIVKKNKTCPKCGPGFYLAKHNNRLSCGKCGYCEMISSNEK